MVARVARSRRLVGADVAVVVVSLPDRGAAVRRRGRAVHRDMRFVLAIVVIVGALAPARPAFAHARLERSVPADRAVLAAAPAEIVLRFNSEVERKFARFTLRLPDGSERALEAPRGGGLTRELTIALGTLGPGEHALAWSVVSRDGHRISGTVRFSVQGR